MRILLAFACVLLCNAVLVKPARALLLVVDLDAPGDGLITRDTSTGLDWLDLTPSTYLSFFDLQSGAGDFLADGWRHATAAELCGVLSDVESPLSLPHVCPNLWFGPESPTGQTAYTDLFGSTTASGGAIGIYDDGDQTSGLTGRMILAQNVNSGEWMIGVFVNNTGIYGRSPQVGHFLVRPVPEPGTALLSGLALALLGAMKRSRA